MPPPSPRARHQPVLGCSTPLASAREAAAFAAQPRASLRPAGAHAMANDDLIKDVFGGSDSDTDDDAPAPAARGADSGDEEAPPADAPPADSDEAEAPKFRSSLEEPEDDEDDEDAADRRAPITGASPSRDRGVIRSRDHARSFPASPSFFPSRDFRPRAPDLAPDR